MEQAWPTCTVRMKVKDWMGGADGGKGGAEVDKYRGHD